MLFSSIVFLFTFLPVTLLVYYLVPGRLKNIVLLLASLVFYAWGEPVYVILMVLSILFNYVSGIDIERNLENPFKAKQSLVIAVAVNLLILGFFKYYGFLIESLNAVLPVELPYKELALPIGISFYTFQTMSYTIDVFRKDAPAQKNIINLGAYVTMFPQLIAGPIVRYQTVAEQLNHRKETQTLFASGVERFVIGLGKKVLLANNIGLLWSQISSMAISELTVMTSWLGVIAFGLQIYFDFSGYSDMAIGLGRMFGFELLENFNYPYISQSITEFWRRWHISLGTWFRDYVYIPLGGNRKGKRRTYLNVFIVWFLTGLWHGASWNFILWGLYFGIIITIEKVFLMKWLIYAPRLIRHFYTLVLLIIGWGLFAFENLSYLKDYLRVMFGLKEVALYDQVTLYYLMTNGVLLIILVIASTPLAKQMYQKLKQSKRGELLDVVLSPIVCLLILILSTAYLVDSSYNPFLYFRF